MILHIATLVFVILKVMNFIHWSWLLVFLPSILAFIIPLLFLMVGGLFIFKAKG